MINRLAGVIIKSPPKSVPSLIRLNRLALKKIFENLSSLEEMELEYGIKMWTHKVLPRLGDIGYGALKKHYSRQLNVIVNALIDLDNGKYDKEKDNFKRCEIDYKKAYGEGL